MCYISCMERDTHTEAPMASSERYLTEAEMAEAIGWAKREAIIEAAKEGTANAQNLMLAIADGDLGDVKDQIEGSVTDDHSIAPPRYIRAALAWAGLVDYSIWMDANREEIESRR